MAKNIKQNQIEKDKIIKKINHNRIITFSIIGIVIILFIYNNYFTNEEKNQDASYLPQTPPTQTAIAPDFNLPDLSGKYYKLSDFKDKVIILDFWATWCPPCRKGIPDLIAIQKEYANVQVIGISVDQNPKEVIPDFVKEYKINYPVLIADEAVLNAFGGIQNIPTTFVIDKNGKIISKYVGLVEKEVFERDIKRAG